MTEEIFRKGPFRDQLFAFIQSDCGQAMLRILERKPSSMPSINGIHHTDAVVARLHCADVGANQTVSRIKDLSEPWNDTPPIVEASMRAQWIDHMPAQIREAYEKLQNQPQ